MFKNARAVPLALVKAPDDMLRPLQPILASTRTHVTDVLYFSSAFLGPVAIPVFAGHRSSHSSKPNEAAPWARRRRVLTTQEFHNMGPVTGTIKRLVSDKGFGFVAAPDGNEYFFHQSACNGVSFDALREGESVTFQTGQGPKGPRAENITRA